MLHTISKEYLERLVVDFETSPHLMRQAIQECWAEAQGRFVEWTIPILATPQDSQGSGYLLSFLMQHVPLAALLGDPNLCTSEEAVLIARKACRMDRTFERQVGNLLAGGIRLDCEQTLRLLTILESIGTTGGMLPILTGLLRHHNPKVRSKAALLMGRGKRNSAWVVAQMTEPDGRTRANAVESLWGLDGAEAIEVFLMAAQDPEPRVVVNGAIGLYRARQTTAIEILMVRSGDASPGFRCSACWGMGQTQDPRFLPVLARLIRDPEPTVRSNALRASSAIRARVTVLKRDPLKVYVRDAKVQGKGLRELSVSLRHGGGAAIPALCPLAFSLEEDGMPVTRYEVYPELDEDVAATGLVIPVGREMEGETQEAVSRALRQARVEKRAKDPWATVCYSHGDSMGASLPPLLQTSKEQLEKGMELAERGYYSGMLPAIESAMGVLPAGQRAVVVVGNEQAESTSIVFQRNAHQDSVVAALRNMRVAVHGILLPGCTPLFRSALGTLVKETGGKLVAVAGAAELEQQLVAMMATAHVDYRIRYWGFEESKGSGQVRLTVATLTSMGEASVAITHSS